MRFSKVIAGTYTSENGFTIKSNACKGMFTGRMMKADFWYIYDSENNRIDGACTLREAKQIVENL